MLSGPGDVNKALAPNPPILRGRISGTIPGNSKEHPRVRYVRYIKFTPNGHYLMTLRLFTLGERLLFVGTRDHQALGCILTDRCRSRLPPLSSSLPLGLRKKPRRWLRGGPLSFTIIRPSHLSTNAAGFEVISLSLN